MFGNHLFDFLNDFNSSLASVFIFSEAIVKAILLTEFIWLVRYERVLGTPYLIPITPTFIERARFQRFIVIGIGLEILTF